MTQKFASILRHRYAECMESLNVFRGPLLKIALCGYGTSTTAMVMYLVRGFLGVPNDTVSVMALTSSILFPLKL
jgi:hypothetical protein